MTTDEPTGNLPAPIEPSGALAELPSRVLDSLDVGTREIALPPGDYSLVARTPAVGHELSEFARNPRIYADGSYGIVERYAARESLAPAPGRWRWLGTARGGRWAEGSRLPEDHDLSAPASLEIPRNADVTMHGHFPVGKGEALSAIRDGDLWGLDLHFSAVHEELSNIAHLESLRRFVPPHGTRPEALEVLGALTGLHELDMNQVFPEAPNRWDHEELLRTIGTLGGLQELTFDKVQAPDGIPAHAIQQIGALSELRILRMPGPRFAHLRDFSFLGDLSNLEEADLNLWGEGLGESTSLARDLARLKKLRRLTLTGMPLLPDLDALGNLTLDAFSFWAGQENIDTLTESAFAFHLVGRFVPGLQFAGKRRCPACDQITEERSLRRTAPPNSGIAD